MKTTLLKKLLTFLLPITIIPLLLMLIFYYIYLHKVLEDEIIDSQKKILNHIVYDIKERINIPSELDKHLEQAYISLPGLSIYDKEMNIISHNFEMKNNDEVNKKYYSEVLEQHFKKVFQRNNDDIFHDKKNHLLTKPIRNNNEIVAYAISNYKSAIDMKMITINHTFLYLLFVIIFTVFILSIFIIIFSLKLLHPLQLLIDGIKKITSGNLSFAIDNISNDEIGVVVDAFNTMTQKRKLVQEELQKIAILDGLTGLYNHKFFYTALENEIARGDRYNEFISLLLIDIDNFKIVNDTYGHIAGDTILIELSKRLMTRARTTDYVCRYGGEEIAIILVETDIIAAKAIADSLRLLIEKEPFLIEDGRYISITVSIGVSTYNNEAKDPSTIFMNADKALYEAKDSGRNCTCVFEKNND
ncbi:MAG: GGDEF domain-containing protein [Sulfurovum sp.]|nr:GGDEF domain-containing protein [Sulfurovum sp.]